MKLTKIEFQCLTEQENKNLSKHTFSMLEKYASKLSPKDNFYTNKCIKVLKEEVKKNIDISNTIFKVYELKENILNLLKEDSNGEKRAVIRDKENIKNIVVTTMGEGKRDLETIYVDFSIIVKPFGDSKAAVGREIERIIVNNDRLGTKIIAQLLPQIDGFAGTGTYQGYIRSTPVAPGDSIKARNDISIDTTYAKDPKSFKEYVEGISQLFDLLDEKVVSWLDVENYDDENVAAGSDETEEEKRDKEFKNSEREFDNPDDEQIEKGILSKLRKEGLKREKNLEIELLTEKIQKLSGKTVIFE